MRKYIFWGIMLIVIGVLWLLKISGIFFFTFGDFLALWPLILIWIGIGLLPIKDGYKIALDIVGYIIGVLILLHPIEFQKKTTRFDYEEEIRQSSTFHTYKNHETAQLTLKAGASEIHFRPDRANLINVSSTRDQERVELDVDEDGLQATVYLGILNVGHNTHAGVHTVYLHPEPVWSIDYKVGATDSDIDLSPFKVKSLELSSGASNIDLKIGDLYPEVNVDISMGASALHIAIPDNMSCYIENNTVLSGIGLEGFTKDSSGFHTSILPDSISKGTIRLKISAGVSDVSVVRYN
ncbi:hypothetical protein LJC68_02890 [Bacteroidales bacterium OttesenSCG-928-B11]|nr:hypothetical protein [Bacteroidales bacterium OttesenSCG-928-B11]MDL2326185.1 hypothetical protein [Bacteroidales bacterium OttesenSCG-928-A14]